MKNFKDLVNKYYDFFSDNLIFIEEGIKFSEELLGKERRMSYMLRGYLDLCLGNFEESYDKYTKIISEDNHYEIDININQSNLHDCLEIFYDGIKESWEKIYIIMNKKRKTTKDLRKLGIEFFSLGLYDITANCYKEYLTYNRNDCYFTFLLGETLECMGKTNEAIKYYKKAKKLSSEIMNDPIGIYEGSCDKLKELRQ